MQDKCCRQPGPGVVYHHQNTKQGKTLTLSFREQDPEQNGLERAGQHHLGRSP